MSDWPGKEPKEPMEFRLMGNPGTKKRSGAAPESEPGPTPPLDKRLKALSDFLLAKYGTHYLGFAPDAVAAADQDARSIAGLLAAGAARVSSPAPDYDALANEYLADAKIWPLGASSRIKPAVRGFAAWLRGELEVRAPSREEPNP